jgi:glycerate kinase
MIAQLDKGLHNLAVVIERDLGVKVGDISGAGAAGELGAGYQDIYGCGIDKIVNITPEGVTREEAMKHAAGFLTDAVKHTINEVISILGAGQ